MIKVGGYKIIIAIVKLIYYRYECNMMSSTSDNCKDADDGVCVIGKLQSMNMVDKEDDTSVCANCGKEGSSGNMNT